MKIISSLFVGGMNLLMPVADQVPNFDMAPSCRAAAQIPMADAQSSDACMREENAARAQLVQLWQSFAARDRSSCTAEASSAGLPSYVELLVCLQIASNVEGGQRTQLKGARRK
jgi:hypothetical protein